MVIVWGTWFFSSRVCSRDFTIAFYGLLANFMASLWYHVPILRSQPDAANNFEKNNYSVFWCSKTAGFQR